MPINIPRSNTAKKHSLSVKMKTFYSNVNVLNDALVMTLAGSGVKTNMEYIEVADLSEDSNIAN